MLAEMDITPDMLNECFDEFNMHTNFVVYYVSALVGLQHFKKEKCRKKYSNFVTVSDEAFDVLTLENNSWSCWMAMAKDDHWNSSPVPTK